MISERKTMPSTFWSNTIWYILLGISNIIELVFIFTKVKDWKRVLAIYITISGMTYTFELTILSGLRAYQYLPKIIPQSPYDDAIMGNYFSQFSVSATALLIAVYDLKYYWYFVFAGVYGIIEELFLKLGIYKQNWYRTWMTVIGLLLLFWVTKKIYKSGSKNIGRIQLYIYIFFGLITLHLHTMWIFKVLGIHAYGPSLHITPEKASIPIIIAAIYMLLVGSIIMVIYFSKINWWLKAVVILLLYIAHYICLKLGIMYYKAGWFLGFTTITIFGMYLYIFILDTLYGQTKKQLITK
jgi:hypothetical protein